MSVHLTGHLSSVCMASGHTLTDQANYHQHEPQRIDINESSIACMYGCCMYCVVVRVNHKNFSSTFEGIVAGRLLLFTRHIQVNK